MSFSVQPVQFIPPSFTLSACQTCLHLSKHLSTPCPASTSSHLQKTLTTQFPTSIPCFSLASFHNLYFSPPKLPPVPSAFRSTETTAQTWHRGILKPQNNVAKPWAQALASTSSYCLMVHMLNDISLAHSKCFVREPLYVV